MVYQPRPILPRRFIGKNKHFKKIKKLSFYKEDPRPI